MALKAVVVSSGSAGRVVVDDMELVEVLGWSEDVGVQLDDVLKIVSETVGKSISTESELMIELSGSVAVKANAEAKWLVFNVGGSGERSTTLKVTLKTMLKPDGGAAAGEPSVDVPD